MQFAWDPKKAASKLREASAFFVDLPLCASSAASADDSDNASTFRVAYDEESTLLRQSEGEKTIFTLGMIRIVESDCQRVTEGGRRLFERYAVFALCENSTSAKTWVRA